MPELAPEHELHAFRPVDVDGPAVGLLVDASGGAPPDGTSALICGLAVGGWLSALTAGLALGFFGAAGLRRGLERSPSSSEPSTLARISGRPLRTMGASQHSAGRPRLMQRTHGNDVPLQATCESVCSARRSAAIVRTATRLASDGTARRRLGGRGRVE